MVEQLEVWTAMVSCRGKTALVTNASRVPGGAAAMALASAGAQVLVHDDRSSARLESIAEKIRSTGGIAKAIAADVSTAEGPHRLARRTRDIVGDRLDILVYNPSIPNARSTAGATVEIFDAQFAASARAPYFLVQQLLPILNRGSSIIFTCTHSALETVDALPIHLSTRNAIIGLTKHFAVLLGPRGIRVNAIDVQCSTRSRPVVTRCVGETIGWLASSEAKITGETVEAHLPRIQRARRAAAVAANRR